MKYALLYSLLVLLACNQPNAAVQQEVQALKEKLNEAEKKLAASTKDETTFVHTVYFWMIDATTDEQKVDFVKNGLSELVKISTIHKTWFGPPAMTPRKVVDNSYDIALICHFKDKAAQDIYQDHPIHLKFIEDYKHLWERVQVYDNLVAR